MKEKAPLPSNPFETELFLKEAPATIPESDLLNLPLSASVWSGPTVFVNAKQCHAIMRRRLKKMQKYNSLARTKVKPKVKYAKRSEHAKRRQRTSNGKFISRVDSQQADSFRAEDQDFSEKGQSQDQTHD